MKKFLVFLCAMFVCAIAFAHTIEWYVDDTVYQTTTCNSGDNITPPTAPAKYGYHLAEWENVSFAQLEYIESTGTQYIDTGVSGGQWEVLAQNTATNPTRSQVLFMNNLGNESWAGCTAATIYDFGNIAKTYNEKYLYNQNIDIRNPLLFVGATNNFPYVGKVYYCKITQNGTLVRNLVPAKRNSDNVVGMYDTVSQTFFENAGTGTFIAGPEVGNL